MKKKRKKPSPVKGKSTANMGIVGLTSTTIQKSQQFSGPLPHPDLFQGYENVVSGAAERILAMVERQQEQRFTYESSTLEKNGRLATRGQVFGFLIAASCVVGTGFCAYIDQPWIALVLFGGTTVNIVARFLEKNKN